MAEGYVMDLRKKIGHVPMVIACASLIIYDENRGILLQKRADNGKWCYHGGSVEPNEKVEEAAKRELYEEVGLKAGKINLYTVASGTEQHFILMGMKFILLILFLLVMIFLERFF